MPVREEMQERLRALPGVDELLQQPWARALLESGAHPRDRVVRAARAAIERARRALREGGAGQGASAPAGGAAVGEAEVLAALAEDLRPRLRPVINATGVVLHTNLGRAPLADEAVARIAAVARGYSNLEMDLASGARGSRYAAVEPLLCELLHAEAALVVNNNAAAMLLALGALAQGREVIVSRGELVEIGGGFRIPDVLRQSGATLVEVGTTNRTRLADYEAALSPHTALLLKVHRSNFAIVGFTEEAPVAELAALGRRARVPVLHDLGSGALVDLGEPTAARALADGADLIAFSGDKLLGGPQSGILAGRRDLVEAARKHPLNRALRVDKLTVAALEATLRLYRDGLEQRVPAVAMLTASTESLQARAEALRAALERRGVRGSVVECEAQAGGGALPLARLDSRAVRIGEAAAPAGPDALADALRAGDPAVVAVVRDGAVNLDVRALADADLEPLADAVAVASRRGAGL